MKLPRMDLSKAALVRRAVFAAASCGGAVYGVRLAGLSETLFPLWIWPVMAACGYAAYRFTGTGRSREKTAGFVFSLLLVFTQLLGRQFDLFTGADGFQGAGGFLRCLRCLLCAGLLAPAAGWPAAALLKALGKSGCAPAQGGHLRFFLRTAGALALLWQPYHLAYWPGLAEYDSGYQLWQTWNGVYSASNPLFHTLVMGLFYRLGEGIGSVSAGIAVFCFLQQVFMASCIAFALAVIRRNGTKQWLTGVSVLFFGLFPVFGMLSISMTKDVPFYSLVLVQMALVYDGCRRAEGLRTWRYWAALTAVTVTACLFRANAVAALFLVPPVLCLSCREKAFRRRLLAFMTGGTLLACGINEVLIRAVDAERPEVKEMMSVPAIQLARVTRRYGEVYLDMEENHADLVDLPMAYIPYVADLSKWNWKVDGGNAGEFLGLWARWGKAYPEDYADAFLLVTKGYWFIGDRSYAKVYGDAYELHTGVLPSRVTAGISTIRDESFLPGFREHLEQMYSANGYLDIPVFRRLFCPALYVWILLFMFTSAVCGRRQDVRTAALGGIVYLAGLLTGPCCILRYALLFMLLAPFLAGTALSGPERDRCPAGSVQDGEETKE